MQNMQHLLSSDMMMRVQDMEMEDGVEATNIMQSRILVPRKKLVRARGPKYSEESLEQHKVTLRDYFPESWLFSINYTNAQNR